MDAGAYRNGKPLHFFIPPNPLSGFGGSPFARESDKEASPLTLPKKICFCKDFLERGGIGVISAVFARGADTRQMRHIPTKERADLPQGVYYDVNDQGKTQARHRIAPQILRA